MTNLRFVNSLEEIKDNFVRYGLALRENLHIRAKAGQARAWYVIEAEDGTYRLAPSKFIGYAGMTGETYAELYNVDDGLDGRETEKILIQLSREVPPRSPQEQRLLNALRALLGTFGKTPSKLARFRVMLPVDPARAAAKPWGPSLDNFHERIHSDPAVCGGRPVIRGTRMPVSDILSMMADGMSASEILADFPYIAAADVSAALLFGSQASSHRIMQAAE